MPLPANSAHLSGLSRPPGPQYIFAEVCLSAKALRLWEALERGPLNFTQIHTLFHRNLRTGELESLCKELTGRIDVLPGKGSGREIVVQRR